MSLTLLDAARGMKLAYEDQIPSQHWWPESRFDHPLIRAVSVRHLGTSVVYLVGTETLRQWAGNANALPVKWGDLWCHAGFRNAARTVAPWVHAQEPELIVGHSRGGAVAHLLDMTWSDCPVVTFAPARSVLGRPPWSRALNVVNRDDAVPKMPPWPYRTPGTDVALPWEPFDWEDDHRMHRIIPALAAHPLGSLAAVTH